MSVVLIRSLILYIVVIFGVRLMGKRQLGELQPSELVITILISNIATLPLEDTSIPLILGILPILTLVCFEVVISWVTLKSLRMRRIISGRPKIIVLTSRTTEIDEVMAMTLGADDFVPKPYSARVLVARINALLRRTAAAGERSTLVHKGLEIDLARSMVTNTQTGTSTELTKNELRILSLLLSRAGKIVSRSAIMQDLWDSDAFVDDNTLTVNINRLRTTLEKIGIKGYLTTHRGQGYSV